VCNLWTIILCLSSSCVQMRDYAVLLLHTGKEAEGRDLLGRYQEWLLAGGDKKAGKQC
jgi:hypothetical protein